MLGGPSQGELQTLCPFLLGEAPSKAMEESIHCLCLLPCLAPRISFNSVFLVKIKLGSLSPCRRPGLFWGAAVLLWMCTKTGQK